MQLTLGGRIIMKSEIRITDYVLVKISSIVTAIMAVAFFLTANYASAAPMTAEALKAEYVGKTLSFVAPNGAEGKVKFSKNGKARLWKTNFDIKRDTGTWRFKGNRICNTWKKVRGGKEKCFTITKIGPKKFTNQDGTITTAK